MNRTLQQRTKTVVAAIAIAGLAVVGMDAYTYAATGDSLLLGKSNKANQTTRITSTGNGPALSLHAKGKRPALAVDSKAKVVRLNADRVDGKHAASLQNNVRVYTATSGSSNGEGIFFVLPNFPKGRYQATYSVYMNGTDGTPTNPGYGYCHFYRADADVSASAGMTTTTAVSTLGLALSSSDIINKTAARWHLVCQAYRSDGTPNAWSITSGFPVRVTLTKIDKTIGGRLTTARTGPNAHLTTR